MSRLPPIPPEQRVHAGHPGERDAHAEPSDEPKGARDRNLREQGRHGNPSQNLAATQWKTQER